jgi:hypothetical protein
MGAEAGTVHAFNRDHARRAARLCHVLCQPRALLGVRWGHDDEHYRFDERRRDRRRRHRCERGNRRKRGVCDGRTGRRIYDRCPRLIRHGSQRCSWAAVSVRQWDLPGRRVVCVAVRAVVEWVPVDCGPGWWTRRGMRSGFRVDGVQLPNGPTQMLVSTGSEAAEVHNQVALLGRWQIQLQRHLRHLARVRLELPLLADMPSRLPLGADVEMRPTKRRMLPEPMNIQVGGACE